MTIKDLDIKDTLKKAKGFLDEDVSLSAAAKTMMLLLIMIVEMLANRLGLNSKNSSKPPSQDPNREKKNKKDPLAKKPGGQKGHPGNNLKPVTDPDEIKKIFVDKKKLPRGKYHEVGYTSRQVIDIKISRHVIEYQAQILANENGKKFFAEYPEELTRAVQYGHSVKSHAVYLSQYQLLPYNRVDQYFDEEMKIPISPGSIQNFNKQAYQLLEDFDALAKKKLITASVLHVDETGINVKGKQHWLHLTANEKWTYFYPHAKRGSDATKEIGILEFFKGVLCHDHWKPYFIYSCDHSLCNAHHLRELQRAYEQDEKKWALSMKELLIEINKKVKKVGGELPENVANFYYDRYRNILEKGKKESPLSKADPLKKKRGRVAKTKSRNLLERLINFEEETLRFMREVDVPFTNNLAENNIRMTKVHQKISGCFMSMEGAYIFCRIRSYLSTCRKQGVSVTDALSMLFEGKMPAFMNEQL